MELKKYHILFCLAKMPLLLLYISFFIVQLFYNFDIAGRPADTASIVLHTSSHQTLKKATVPANKKISFRMNKRYHPQPAVSCDPFIIEPVICYVTSKLHVHYSTGFIPSSTPPARPLRGPPAVV